MLVVPDDVNKEPGTTKGGMNERLPGTERGSNHCESPFEYIVSDWERLKRP
jgi:hypothetical protein